MEQNLPLKTISFFRNSIHRNKMLLALLLLVFLNANNGFSQAGAGLTFDGADDYVNCGNIMPATYTKEAWFLVSNLGLNNNLISGGSDGQHALYPPSVYGNRISAGHNGTWNAVQDPTPIVANTWYHVALTYDAATTTMKLYTNGVLVSTNTNVAPFISGNALRIGAFENSGNLLGGKIDEVRIWNRVLTQCEIQSKMNAELPAGQTGLVAYYKFNQGVAAGTNTGITSLTDSSGNSNIATLTNFALTGTASNWTSESGVVTGSTSPAFSLLSVATSQTFCAGATVANLSTTGTGTIKWYTLATGGTVLADTTTLTTSTYYVSQTTGTCESDRTAVAVTVNTTAVPTATSPQILGTTATVASLTAAGTGLKWYNVATGGTALVSTTTLTTGTYYVTQTLNSCESARTPVQVNINGAALNFDGVNDKVSFSNQPLSNLTNFTFETWVNTSLNTNQTIYSEGNTSDNNPMLSISKLPNTAGLEIVLRNASGLGLIVSTTTGTIPLNTWTHVAFVRTSATTASLYINGVNTDNFTFADPGTIAANVANIGVRQRVGFDGYFIGSMDETRIWNRALTQCEIQNNRNAELSAGQTGLVSYYKFNQGIPAGTNTAINTLTDSSGNNNTGTLTNFALTGATSNWVATGSVVTGSASPAFSLLSVPTAQTLCSSTGATVANLAATGTSIKWYNVATGGTALTSTTILSSATYYVSQTTDTCESPRTAVTVTVNFTAVPTTTTTQPVVFGATVANLTATGTNLKWYNVATAGTELVSTTILSTGIYYVTQTLNSCESARIAVQVNIDGAALNLDGMDDNLTVPHTAAFEFGLGNVTLEANIKLAGSQGNYAGIITKATTTNNKGIQLVCYNNKLALEFGDGTTNLGINNGLIGTKNLNDGNWHHVAVTVNRSTATILLFVDGIVEASLGGSINLDITTTTELFIGKERTSSIFFNGSIDEVRVWNRALTQCEIQNNKNTEIAANQTGLLGYYQFNQGFAAGINTAVNTLTDATANGNTGTLNGFALTGTTSNWTALGGVVTGTTSPALVLPPAPVATDQTVCAGTAFTSLVATGTALKWYNVASGGSFLTGSIMATGTYYVSQAPVCEESPRTAVVVTVITTPVPTAVTQTFNAGATVANLTATGTNLKWYTTTTGGTALVSTIGLSARLYYVSQTINGCESVRTSVQVNINGAALAFNGTTNYVAVGSNSAYSNLGAASFTLEAWVKPSTIFNVRSIIRKDGDYSLYFNGTRLCSEVFSTGSGGTFYRATATAGSAVANTWVHVSAVWTGTTCVLYVNGVVVTSIITTGSLPNVSDLNIGKSLALNQYFLGAMDEVRIWNRALTQCEIQNNKNAELVAGQTGLVAYYKFNQGIASAVNTGINTLTDSSGNGFSGTLNSFALSGTNSNWFAPGGVTTGTTSPAFSLLSVATTQTVFSGATVADLTATGTALKWYNVATGGTALVSTTALSSGTYYVSQTTGTCESARTAVAVTMGDTTTWTVTNGVGSWDNGTPTATSRAIISGNYSQAENLTAYVLYVTGTALVSVPTGYSFTVSGGVNVASTASLTFENNANLIQSGSANANTGNVTVKRETSMIRQDYTYWSSPVVGQNLLTFSPATIATRFYILDEVANAFVSVNPSSTNFDNSNIAKGFSIRAPNTFPATSTTFVGSFTGVPNSGTISIPITNSGVGKGYNFIGNPYPSPINALSFLATNPGTLYFWTHTAQGAALGTNYASFNTLGGTKSTTVVDGVTTFSNVPNGTIQTGQGFFLQTATAGNAVFTNAMRANNTTGQFFKTKAVQKHRIWINLSNQKTSNQILLGYMNGATNQVDESIDGKQIETGTSISSTINNQNYVIQGRALPFDNNDLIALSLKADIAGDYTLSIDDVDGIFAGNQAVFLKDNLLKITQNLKQKAYSFSSGVGVFDKRFEVLFVDSSLGIENQNLEENGIVIFKKDNTINIKTTGDKIKLVQLFDVNGRLIARKNNINTSETTLTNLNLARGVILVQITQTDNKVVTRKLVY